MRIVFQDFNDAEAIILAVYPQEWREIERVLTKTPLHLKASGQKGIEGTAIFDPIGTNDYLKQQLLSLGWQANIPIPATHRYFGTDVDLGKPGVVAEAQFSTYPYLMSNLVRTDLFHRLGVKFIGETIGLLVVVMKTRMLPASQGTLYYEQGVRQIDALASSNIFKIPTRLVGFFEDVPSVTDAVWTRYAGRTSRTIEDRDTRRFECVQGKTKLSRAAFLPVTPT